MFSPAAMSVWSPTGTVALSVTWADWGTVLPGGVAADCAPTIALTGTVSAPTGGVARSVTWADGGAVLPGGVAADCVATEALAGTVLAPEVVTTSLASVSPTGVLVVPEGERGSQLSGIPTCGCVVTTVISAASTPRSFVIPPSPHIVLLISVCVMN